MPLLEVVDIDLRVDPQELLSVSACEGWKIDPWLPISIRCVLHELKSRWNFHVTRSVFLLVQT
jgi:hypothetical protein